jgi:uncharacterized protein (DUF2235 family)
LTGSVGAAHLAKKIIVLSDGTGNSAGKVWRTNVWRTFEALDLTSDDQVAMYDDGVGTSSFKPIAILGGAFGYGLKRNVLSLYAFLCRNYKSHADYKKLGFASDDDEIFAFGFSRGAFTIRVLIGLVLDQGLVEFETEEELSRKTKAAYRQYRARNFATYTRIEVPFRWLRNLFVPAQHDEAQRPVANVRFLGLWDTVAAYGLPIDEMMRGISRYLWPLELPRRQLDWTKVSRACHALSIDDERTTFHPVLWDESKVAPPSRMKWGIRRTRDEQVSQVWFAGVHANVGGGYPDDSLAHVSLAWIMKEASVCGLRFKGPPVADPDSVINLRSSQDKDGRLYDSRSGVGGYYRYGPRKISELCHSSLSNDLRDRVEISAPKIHYSVFERLRVAAHFYAPIGLPDKYDVVTRNGLIVPFGRGIGEVGSSGRLRTRLAELTVWNVVWRRRAVYFISVAATLHLVSYPLIHQFSSAGELTTKLRFVSDSVRAIGNLLPLSGWRWADAYAKDPLKFLIAAIGVAVTISVGSRLGGEIRDQMRTIWNLSAGRVDAGTAIKLIREQRIARYKGALNYLFYLLLFAAALSPYLFTDSAGFPKLVRAAWEAFRALPSVAARGGGLSDFIDSTAELIPGHASIAFLVGDTARVIRTVFVQISHEYASTLALLLLIVLLLPDRYIYALRSSHAYRKSLSVLKLKLAPAVFAILIVYLGAAFTGRYLFALRDGAGAFCTPTEIAHTERPACKKPSLSACARSAASYLGDDEPDECKVSCPAQTMLIDTRELCAASGMRLSLGQLYTFTIAKATLQDIQQEKINRVGKELDDLKKQTGKDAAPDAIAKQTEEVERELQQRGIVDSNLEWRFCYDFLNVFCYPSGVQKVLGTSYLHTALVVATWPLRRTLDRPLGNVILRYGSTGNEEAFVDPDAKAPDPNRNGTPFRPTVSGELFVYLDKQASGFLPGLFDRANSGIAKITVQAHPD